MKRIVALVLVVIMISTTPAFASNTGFDNSKPSTDYENSIRTQGEEAITGGQTDETIGSPEDATKSTGSTEENTSSTEPTESTEPTNSTEPTTAPAQPVSRTAITTMIMSGNVFWDVRVAAKQAMYGYDTIQGACANKGYAYMSLYNRKKEKIKIVKVELSTMKVVKVSPVLGRKAHGNTLTFNTRTNEIIVTCGKSAKKKLAIVNANTLKLIKTVTVKVSKKTLGEKYKGISAIAYNKSKNIYVAKAYGSSNKIVLLNSKFKVIKRVKIQGNRSYLLAQGLYTEGNYMYDIQSFKGKHKYNLITIRNVNNGKLIGRITVYSGKTGRLFELENIFRDETTGQWYSSFYRAYVKAKGDTMRENYLFTIDNMPF